MKITKKKHFNFFDGLYNETEKQGLIKKFCANKLTAETRNLIFR